MKLAQRQQEKGVEVVREIANPMVTEIGRSVKEDAVHIQWGIKMPEDDGVRSIQPLSCFTSVTCMFPSGPSHE